MVQSLIPPQTEKKRAAAPVRALLKGLFLGATVLRTGGMFSPHLRSLGAVAAEMEKLLVPSIDLARSLGSNPVSWHPLVAYASTVTLALALAIVVVNRKELSYASA